MDTTSARQEVERALEGRALLSHPFYRRWEAGHLSRRELASYAGQYRHVESCLVAVLDDVAMSIPRGEARRLVENNLHEERTLPAPHVELFEQFAQRAGAAATVEMTPATAGLVGLYERSVKAGPVAALAVVSAYEQQAAGVAASKADGLRHHYGFGDDAACFWDVHASLEAAHADWSIRALAMLAEDTSDADVYGFARRSAEAWWGFLDERESAAAA